MPNKSTVPFDTTASSKNMLKKIEDNLRERMCGYTDSRQPTDDEVTIAWLISEIDRLNEIIKSQCLQRQHRTLVIQPPLQRGMSNDKELDNT